MGFVARKSFKVMPGVRMTVSKSGLSAAHHVNSAITMVEQVEPAAIAAVALCELYLESGRHYTVDSATETK